MTRLFTFRNRRHLIFATLLMSGLAMVPWIPFGSFQAAEPAQCFPFLGRTPIPGELSIVSGSGEVTTSSHPTVLKPGFGKGWKVSSGGYNPQKKQLMVVIKDRYYSLFLDKPLADGQTVAYRAENCGGVNEFGVLLGEAIRPGLFFTPLKQRFAGKIKRSGNRLQGTFAVSAGFYLTDKPDQESIGSAKGRFAFQLKPGKSSRFPEPPPGAIRGLW
ncbi:MAG: hypothetical protein VKP63_00565 [Cyanobacteriota bacterium]|nr:hypothetical protein [Cyanobacteriota bacterium]